jgi:fructokinase
MSEHPGPEREPGFLVIGESLVDLVTVPGSDTFTAYAGGSPLNVAVGLARLGRPVTLVTEFGDDHCGRLIGRRLRDSGVTVRRNVQPTSIAIAALDDAGSAEYDFRFGWRLDAAHVGPLSTAVCLHTGSLASLIEPGAAGVLAAVREARRHGLAVSFDPNVRPSLTPDRAAVAAKVEEFVAEATIVKASSEDATWLYPGSDPLESARRWARGGRLVILTMGARGCVGLTPAHAVAVPAQPARVADTVGAGDTFTAALLTHLQVRGALAAPENLTPDEIRGALEFATRAAAITCENRGAYAPTEAELRDRCGD